MVVLVVVLVLAHTIVLVLKLVNSAENENDYDDEDEEEDEDDSIPLCRCGLRRQLSPRDENIDSLTSLEGWECSESSARGSRSGRRSSVPPGSPA